MTTITGVSSGMDETDTDQSWRELSSCRQMNPDLFFSGGGASHKAKKVCIDCPVREMCLELALKNDERFGIWGGLTRDERAKLQRKQKKGRKKEPAPATNPVAA